MTQHAAYLDKPEYGTSIEAIVESDIIQPFEVNIKRNTPDPRIFIPKGFRVAGLLPNAIHGFGFNRLELSR